MKLTFPPSKVVAARLVALGLATDDRAQPWGWARKMPSAGHDNFIAIGDAPGAFQGMIMRTLELVEKYGIQIIVRSADDSDAYVRARAIQTALEKTTWVHLTVDGQDVLFEGFVTTIPLAPLPQLENNRQSLYVLNGNLSADQT